MIVLTDRDSRPFQIDENDYDAVQQYTWHIDSAGYPRTSVKRERWIPMRLHVFLLGKAPKGLEWDHKNQDPLDNRRDNIRLATKVIQRRNEKPRIDNESGVRGVHRSGRRWRARISDGKGNVIRLGSFVTVEEAIQVRKEAEQKYWGNDV